MVTVVRLMVAKAAKESDGGFAIGQGSVSNGGNGGNAGNGKWRNRRVCQW